MTPAEQETRNAGAEVPAPSSHHVAAPPSHPAAPSPPKLSFLRRHPVLSAFGALAGLSLFAAYWPVSAVITGVVVAGRATGADQAAWRLLRGAATRVGGRVRTAWRDHEARRTGVERGPEPPAAAEPAPTASGPTPPSPRAPIPRQPGPQTPVASTPAATAPQPARPAGGIALEERELG